METNIPFPDFEPFPRIARVTRAIRHALRPAMSTLLSSHGDHNFEHPLDSPIEPVTDMPTLFDKSNVVNFPQHYGSEGEWVGDEGA